jgi:nicotinamidase-related amidase
MHDQRFIQQLQECDRLIIAGQAKSHCVAWTVSDLLDDIILVDPQLAKKVYLLEDCTSPVVVPGVVDHTDAADASYEWFASAGMNIVKSTDLIF